MILTKEIIHDLDIAMRKSAAIKDSRYMDWLFQLKCAQDLMALGLYPDAKEWTEACACYSAARKYAFTPSEKGVFAVVAGDGKRPRLGALLAFMTKWQVISVDPILEQLPRKVDRLTCLKQTLKQATDSLQLPCSGLIILFLPHSHVSIKEVGHYVNWIAETTGIFSMLRIVSLPCCVKHDGIGKYVTLMKEYTDCGVFSPKRKVMVFGRTIVSKTRHIDAVEERYGE